MTDELDDRDDLEDIEDEEILEDEDEGETSDEVSKLRKENEEMKKYLARANREAKERRLALKALEKEGLSVEDAVNLKKQLQDQEHKKALRRGDVDKIREQIESKYVSQVKEKDETIEKMRRSLHDYLITSRSADALSQLGAKKGANRVINPLLQRHATVVEEDGNYVVRVMDDDGDIRFNDKGDYMTVEDFVGELRTDEVFSELFVQASSSGTGSRPASSQKKTDRSAVPRKSKSQMSMKEKASYIREYGYDKPKVDGVVPFGALPE